MKMFKVSHLHKTFTIAIAMRLDLRAGSFLHCLSLSEMFSDGAIAFRMHKMACYLNCLVVSCLKSGNDENTFFLHPLLFVLNCFVLSIACA